MSTIAGLIRFEGRPVDRLCLESAALRMAAPSVADPVFWCNGPAGLVVRQSVSTPEDLAERQPWLGNGRFVMIYDGRLDNRDELIAALGLSLDPSELTPDGALLFKALERWGASALPRLIGSFALALWDTVERRLLLARDHMGRRTLYTYYGAGFVAFATTFPALLALPGVPRRLNEEKVADFLTLNFLFSEETIYDGIRRVPPATAVTVDGGGVQSTRYWEPDPERRIQLSSDDDYVEAAREQLDQAVACRLRSNGSVVATMSGGLDSSAVASTAARLLAPQKLLTMTMIPPPGAFLPPMPKGWDVDETPFVTAAARMHPNMDLRLLWSEGPHWIEYDPTALFAAGGLPIYGPTNAGWFAPVNEAAVQAGSSVVLGGQAGNATWSWHGLNYLGELFRQGHWIRLLHELNATGLQNNKGRSHLLRNQVLRPIIPNWVNQIRFKIRRKQPDSWSRFSGINPDFAREMGQYQGLRQSGHGPATTGSPDPWVGRLMRLRTHLGSDGRTAMRALDGVEDRDPLADVRLVEFCLAVPADQYLRDGTTRWLSRRALADRLPAEVISKNTLGMQNPEWFSRINTRRPQLIEELAELERSPLAARYLDLPRLSALMREWPADAMAAAHTPVYHHLLPRAFNFGRFLLWFEKGGVNPKRLR